MGGNAWWRCRRAVVHSEAVISIPLAAAERRVDAVGYKVGETHADLHCKGLALRLGGEGAAASAPFITYSACTRGAFV